MGNGTVFFKIKLPPPLDTGIPDYHDFIFIKAVHTTNEDLYLGGGAMSLLVLGEGGGE